MASRYQPLDTIHRQLRLLRQKGTSGNTPCCEIFRILPICFAPSLPRYTTVGTDVASEEVMVNEMTFAG